MVPLPSPVPAVAPGGRRTLIYFFRGHFRAPAGKEIERLGVAATTTLAWAAPRYAPGLPEQGWDSPLELDDSQTRLSTSAYKGHWAMRLSHADQPFKSTPAAAGRTWIADVSFHVSAARVETVIRLQVHDAAFVVRPIPFTRPALLGQLAEAVGLQGIRPLNEIWRLGTPKDLEQLEIILSDPNRRLPLLLMSQQDTQHGTRGNLWSYDPDKLARELSGVAHVVTIPFQLGFEWSNRVGRVWSAYLGAIRLYWPDVHFASGEAFHHPLFMAPEVRKRNMEGRGFGEYLRDMIMQGGRRDSSWGSCLPQSEVASLELKARIEGASAGEKVQLLEMEREYLKQTISDQRAALEQAQNDWLTTENQREEANDENRRLRARVETLLAELGPDKILPPEDLPATYPEVVEWVQADLVGRLWLAPRARRTLAKAEYQEPQVVAEVLQLLATSYRDKMMGMPGADAEFKKGLSELGLSISNSISESQAGTFGEEYYVTGPTGRREFMGLHLRKGTSREPRYCLAVYFYYDDQENLVVVGSLPAHLRNQLS